MKNIAAIVAEILLPGQSIATFNSVDADAWCSLYAQSPPDPDRIICCYLTQGLKPDISNLPVVGQQHPGLQVRVRGRTHDEAEAKAWVVLNYLVSVRCTGVVTASHVDLITHLTVVDEAVEIQSITPSGGPLWVTMDGNRRHIFSINFLANVILAGTP